MNLFNFLIYDVTDKIVITLFLVNKQVDQKRKIVTCYFSSCLKGTATLMITKFYMKDLNKPCILIPVSSKSVEKRRSCGRLNICKWTVMEAAIL